MWRRETNTPNKISNTILESIITKSYIYILYTFEYMNYIGNKTKIIACLKTKKKTCKTPRYRDGCMILLYWSFKIKTLVSSKRI